jgi:di/tricarboxylate transporter
MILSPNAAASRVVSVMVGETIPVLLASFVIAASFTRHLCFGQIRWLNRLGNHPSAFLLVAMILTLSLCSVLSYTSAAQLTYTLLSRHLTSHLNVRLSKAILIGIMVAANIGGFLTPISSPHSIFAFSLAQEQLELDWWDWLMISVPSALLGLVGSWLIIMFLYNLNSVRVVEIPSIESPFHEGLPSHNTINERSSEKVPTLHFRATISVLIAIGTVMMYATIPYFPFWGSMGICAFLPIVLLFGMGLLTDQDLSYLPWDTILLIMGALVLVEASKSSGLLFALTLEFQNLLGRLSPLIQRIAFGLIILIISNVKSHTIAGLIFIPVVVSYVHDLYTGKVFFMVCLMAASLGMIFPFSGLVNSMVAKIRDPDGNKILYRIDFIKVGFPVSLFVFTMIILVPSLLT